MLPREDNELMCRVGRGTAMGDLLRQYWLPFLPSEHARLRLLRQLWDCGAPIPVPRPPLQGAAPR